MVRQGRLAVAWVAFLALFPGAFSLMVALGVDWAAHVFIVTAVVSVSVVDGPLIRTWVDETGGAEMQRYVGGFTSAFTRYSLQAAGWEWPWFNAARVVVLGLGVAVIAGAFVGRGVGLW